MRSLSDAVVRHLRDVLDRPDLSGTRYEILERVAQGGMGTVFRVHDRVLGRDVALKVVSVPGAEAETVARMLREARILARLEHPGIVPIHDVGTLPDGRIFYTMKFVRGRRLDDYLDEAPATDDALRIVSRICEAVAFAHDRGVIHRDLKPENVMVGAFGEVLVMDWGVAKLLRQASEADRPPGSPARPVPTERERVPTEEGNAWYDASKPTVTGTVLGTPGYMPPEQANGKTDAVDERADVYALGIILRLILTGGRSPAVPSPPGDDESPQVLGEPLAAIVRKATAPDRNDRYASVGELAADIARFQAALPVSAHREGPWGRIQRLFKKYRTPILLVAAYLLMRVLLLVFANR